MTQEERSTITEARRNLRLVLDEFRYEFKEAESVSELMFRLGRVSMTLELIYESLGDELHKIYETDGE